MSLGAALAAAAFAFASYAPLRSLAPIAVIGAVAETVFSLGQDRGLGVAWASALAAMLIGLVSYSVAGRVRVPALVVVVSAIVPLLPGLSIYRGLSLLSAGPTEGDTGLLSITTAAAIAIALASGVIFGEYLAQPLKREARRLENRLSGPRRARQFPGRSGHRLRSSRSRRR
jgi:uncharacterized membrane protein YjjB (DUF3815 family)